MFAFAENLNRTDCVRAEAEDSTPTQTVGVRLLGGVRALLSGDVPPRARFVKHGAREWSVAEPTR